MDESLTLHVNESKQVVLKARGSLGLQLGFRCSDTSVVQIVRISDVLLENNTSINIGDSIPAVFKITGLKTGEAKVEFYETQPWNKNFNEIIQKEMLIKVI